MANDKPRDYACACALPAPQARMVLGRSKTTQADR